MNELFLINAAMEDIGVGTAGLVALLGYLVVFIGLIALMVVIMIVGKIMVGKQASAKALIMAIVAHKMGKPLNTLRFKSIKEVQ